MSLPHYASEDDRMGNAIYKYFLENDKKDEEKIIIFVRLLINRDANECREY
jgi:hypothetical protein